jgi:hypothetical protein
MPVHDREPTVPQNARVDQYYEWLHRSANFLEDLAGSLEIMNEWICGRPQFAQQPLVVVWRGVHDDGLGVGGSRARTSRSAAGGVIAPGRFAQS